jgi:hypothetical protein
LHAAIREVLARAVQKGGSTLRDFSNAQGEGGAFPARSRWCMAAQGSPAVVCGTPIRIDRRGSAPPISAPLPKALTEIRALPVYICTGYPETKWALPSTSSLTSMARGGASSGCA